MNTNTPVRSILRRIAAILHEHQETAWARSFEQFADDYEDSPESTKGRIRAVYGGMGSFNDIVLQGPGGMPLQRENDELDHLRSQLYRKCSDS